MSGQIKDPGFGAKYERKTKRIINKDGSFNIKRHGSISGIRDVYQYIIGISWTRFFGLIVIAYSTLNLLFALLYYIIGVEHLNGAEGDGFLSAFYFSVQTFTTVGYGAINPSGVATNLVAAFEAMTGLLSFALATGILYGRFSKPSAKILFSESAIFTPYHDKKSFQFRLVNERRNVLMEMKAEVMLMLNEKEGNGYRRKYYELPLETDSISFFPLNWTIVHVIDEQSPFHGKTEKEIKSLDPEVLILIKGFDDTFSQIVHRRYSYCCREMEWNKKFTRAFSINEHGDVVMNVNEVHTLEAVEG
jgi:inward rectifier potassium channel